MIEGFLSFLQSPEFLTFAATYAGTKLLDAAGSKIKQLKSQSKQKTPEWQFIRCLELAFFATETELGWEHKAEAIYESFEESLLTHQGSFTLASLKSIFETAIGHSVTEEQLEIWVRNFKRELAMGEYPELLKFINIDHYFQSQSIPVQSKTKYILTPNSSVCENKDIIGRDPFITELLKMLESKNSRIQVTGMGGLGKTETLSKLYARLASNKETSFFDHIAFIRFSGDILSDIQSQLDCPPNYLGLQGVEAAKRYLQDICQEKKVLLCLDDIRKEQPLLDDHDPNIEFLHSLGASILLAARAGFPGFDANDLEFLSIDECIQVFERQFSRSITDDKDRKILKDIIENRAGNHTMVVNRLGSMAKVNIWSIPVLSKKLEENNFNFAMSMSNDGLLQQEINKLYQINDTLSEAEKNLLEAFSIFPASPLSSDLCVGWLHEDAGVDEDNCARLLNRLAEQTWLEKRCGSDNSGVSFLMHQLVRTAVQEQVEVQYTVHQKLVEYCSDSISTSTKIYDLKKSSLIVPFAISFIKILFQENWSFSVLTFNIAQYYDTITNYEIALEWFMKSLAISEKFFGKEDPNTAIIYRRIAIIYKDQAKYDLALEWHQKTLGIEEKVLGRDHPNTAGTYNNIAIVYQKQGKYDLALEWHQKALVINERILGKNHLDTVSIYDNIAIVYELLCKHELSLKWFQEALTIIEEIFGKNHPETAMTYNNIAVVYKNQGKYDLALEWSQKALAINERTFGKDHLHTALTYANIGLVYQGQDKYVLALVWLNKALVIIEETLGKNHPDTAKTYDNIANVYQDQGKYDLALEWYTKALTTRENTLGKDHLDTATTYYKIGSIYKTQGKYSLAFKWLRKALPVFEMRLGSEHHRTTMVRESMEKVKNIISSNLWNS